MKRPHDPILLSTGRLVIHTMESTGSQRATPTPGSRAMTEAEWHEYCGKLEAAMRPEGWTRSRKERSN